MYAAGAAIVLSTAVPGNAGGFVDATQSASAAAVANAGETALGEDAATIFYNPAGLTRLARPELLFASGLPVISQTFSHGTATDPVGAPISGNANTNPQVFLLPSLFAAYPLYTDFNVGIGIFVPFGQATKYSDSWIGRYQVQQVALKTLDIRPAIAYRIRDWLSLGAGVDIEYVNFRRSNAIDFGAVCLAQLGSSVCNLLGLLPTAADGRLLGSAQDWTVGYDVGVLFSPAPDLRFGINYQSGTDNSLSGSARFDVPPAASILTAGGAFENTDIRAGLPFPAVLSAGAIYGLNEHLKALIDVSFTQWSRLRQLTVTFNNPTPSATLPLQWHDSSRVDVGGIYRINDAAELRAGFAYDQTPVPNRFRTADLPQGDGIVLAIGLTYSITSTVQVTAAYSYERWMDAPINYVTPTGGTLTGTFHENSHTIGIQTRLQF
jgi:long-chain fatty acid transport protein